MTMTVAIRGDRDSRALVERLSTTSGDAPAALAVTEREADADLLLAHGDDALCSLADDPSPVPALPVATSAGRHGLSTDDVGAFLAALVTDRADVDARTASHPVLSVAVDGDETNAVFDAALVTSEAGHISEYAALDATGELASFRADGVVVSTPVGSAGYGRAAGGPILAHDTGLAVVPISPYTTQPETWVVDTSVTLAVERDESPVSLVVDGRHRRQVAVGEPVRVAVERTVDLIRPLTTPDSAHRLEKL